MSKNQPKWVKRFDYTRLRAHVGHKIVCIGYQELGTVRALDTVSVECSDCGEVLLSEAHSRAK